MKPTRLASAAAASALLALAWPALAQAPSSAPPPQAAPPATSATPAASAYRPIAPAGDILATLQAAGQFATFVKAIQATNLTQIFKAQPNITVLAPTDAAFAALPPGELQAMLQNVSDGRLQKLVTYHLINARLDSSKIKGHGATPIPTVAGTPVTIDGSGAAIKANDATVVQADVMAANGVIHVIDKVLTPGGAPAAAAPPAPAAPAAPPAPPAPQH